jgi:hypothetical protein
MSDLEQLAAVYGPAADYSEHSIGETVTFLEGGSEQTGEIVYCCAAGEVAGKYLAMHYMVDAGNWPTMVMPREIIER